MGLTPSLRILIFHGYLLGGTGSNVYNAQLAKALVALGHEVHLLSQDRHPERHRFVDAAGDWDAGRLEVRSLSDAEPRCTAYRPDIDSLLPVYVHDRYEGVEAKTFAQCSEAEVERYVEANVAAVQEVVARAKPQLALANHLVMGPAILARALGGMPFGAQSRGPVGEQARVSVGEQARVSVGEQSRVAVEVPGRVPFAVKVHGSALEYTVKRDPKRFLPYAYEGIAAARCVLTGSRHTAESLWAALGEPFVEQHDLVRRTRLGPPGVDVHHFLPRNPEEAANGLASLTRRLGEEARRAGHGDAASEEGHGDAASEDGDDSEAEVSAGGGDAFARDEAAAEAALASVDPRHERIVGYVGKLIVSKGVDLLLAAWPLVLSSVPSARLVIVGFGAFRNGLEELLGCLATGDLDAVVALASKGRALEGGQYAPLKHLLAFLETLQGGARKDYLRGCASLATQVTFTGRLDHAELVDLLPACEALVVPSTFPEAFGMVAAEAAACGVLPISAAHSGLAEVSEALAKTVPNEVSGLLSFQVDDRCVLAIATRIVTWLTLEQGVRTDAAAGIVQTVKERWSWEGVAGKAIAAAKGDIEAIPPISQA